MNKTMNITIKSLLFVSLICLCMAIKAQTWVVPEDQKSKTNPVELNAGSIEKGLDIYNKNCKSCHGDPGKANGLKLTPPPPDMSSEKMQANTNAEFFYKISEGRGTMPQMKNILSEEDRWNVINYIHSLNPNYKADAAALTTESFKGNELAISLTADTATKKIIAFVTGNNNGQREAVSNAELLFTVKRYFGNLIIGNARTNALGYAELTVPEGLAGDTFGMLNFVVKFKNEAQYGKVNATIKAPLGKPTLPINVFAKRSLWSWNSQTSWWIILSYIGVVAAVWITILYVITLIAKIPKQGKVSS